MQILVLALIVLGLLLFGKLLYYLFDDGAVQIRYTPTRQDPQRLADILGPPSEAERIADLKKVVQFDIRRRG